MERHFDEEMKQLEKTVLEMGRRVQEAIERSIQALERQDVSLAANVIESDKDVDEMELAVESRCLDLVARHQPVAADLRFLTTAMKINGELERIADLAVDIAQRVYSLAGKPLLKPLEDIQELEKTCRTMVGGGIDAFVRRDVALAKSVILHDATADELRNSVQEELVNDFMARDPSNAPRAVPLLLIARHLERICDHATNIAEDVIYMVEAKVVKHHPEKLE